MKSPFKVTLEVNGKAGCFNAARSLFLLENQRIFLYNRLLNLHIYRSTMGPVPGRSGGGMERRAASHTEEEEMNQRRRLLSLARKGDPKAISKLFELYQVRVLSGDMLNKMNRAYYKSASQQKTVQTSGSSKSGKGEKVAHGSRKSGHTPGEKSTRPSKGKSVKGKGGR